MAHRLEQVFRSCDNALDALRIMHEDCGEKAALDLYRAQTAAFITYIAIGLKDRNKAVSYTSETVEQICSAVGRLP